MVDDRLAAHPSPHISVKAAKFRLDGDKRLCVGHGCIHLQPIADDPHIFQSCGNIGFAVGGDFCHIKVVERTLIARTPLEDRNPTQARLRPL